MLYTHTKLTNINFKIFVNYNTFLQCEYFYTFGFILTSEWGHPQIVIAFINTLMQDDFPEPEGPIIINPCRTRDVSYNYFFMFKKKKN